MAVVNCESQVADDAMDWESTINELSDGANRDLMSPPVVDKNCRSTAQAQQTTEGIGIDSAEIVEIPEILAVVGRTKGKKSGSSSDTSQLHEKLINLKSVGLKLVETLDEKFGISREEIKNVSEKDSAFGAAPIELRTVLQILQEPDQLVQKKRPSIASSIEEGWNSIGRLHDASRDKSGGNEDSSGSQLQDGRESGGEVE